MSIPKHCLNPDMTSILIFLPKIMKYNLASSLVMLKLEGLLVICSESFFLDEVLDKRLNLS